MSQGGVDDKWFDLEQPAEETQGVSGRLHLELSLSMLRGHTPLKAVVEPLTPAWMRQLYDHRQGKHHSYVSEAPEVSPQAHQSTRPHRSSDLLAAHSTHSLTHPIRSVPHLGEASVPENAASRPSVGTRRRSLRPPGY